ncbi:MAG: hypothetical protein ACRCWJ_06530 [Casimicrobium sp.]
MILTLERAEAVIADLKTVCERHGIVLIGTCDDEGVFGEIRIVSRSQNDSAHWSPNEFIDWNQGRLSRDGSFEVDGIRHE